jgi:hypothetical protein
MIDFNMVNWWSPVAGRVEYAAQALSARPSMGEFHDTMKIIPADATISDLEQKALEYERAANDQPEPAATSFKKLAAQCRDWIAALRSGVWIP